MPNLGGAELIIILVIVIILFGGGRIARLGGELGTAIKEFRRGISDADKKDKDTSVTGSEQSQP